MIRYKLRQRKLPSSEGKAKPRAAVEQGVGSALDWGLYSGLSPDSGKPTPVPSGEGNS